MTRTILSIILAAIVSILIGGCTCSEKKVTGAKEVRDPAEWLDTLTNADSQIPELIPMDEHILRFMSSWSIRGAQLAVMRNDSLLYAKGYGWADEEAGRKMEVNSMMRIASASKLITAAAIMKLIEMGKLSLDTKVFGATGVLNDTIYTNAIADHRVDSLTIDHLLLHKGGFSGRLGDPMFTTKDIVAAHNLSAPPTPAELVRIVLGRRMACAPGGWRKYSNFGYMLLSLVIEKASGKSYWEFVNDELFSPAGTASFAPATNYYADRHPLEVHYYGPDGEPVEEYTGSGRMVDRVYGGNDIHGLMGAGGWITSAPALARFVAAIDGAPEVKDVLTPESIGLLTAYDEDDKTCRGWNDVLSHGNWVRTGTLASTHAFIERFPDGECWIIITNTGAWTGHHFSHNLSRLVAQLRSRYSTRLPRRSLW